MVRGIGEINAQFERPECCPHYENAKKSFNGKITFCSECDEPRCAINRYETQRYAATADLINAIQRLPHKSVANFTFHDFFSAEEIDRFLQVYTSPLKPLNKQNAKERFYSKFPSRKMA